MRKLR